MLLEWFDPPYASGRWNPEIVAKAGGLEPLARVGKGSPTRAPGTTSARGAHPDVIVLAPWSFTLERTGSELATLVKTPAGRTSPPSVPAGSVLALTARPISRVPARDWKPASGSPPPPSTPTSSATSRPPRGRGWKRLAPQG